MFLFLEVERGIQSWKLEDELMTKEVSSPYKFASRWQMRLSTAVKNASLLNPDSRVGGPWNGNISPLAFYFIMGASYIFCDCKSSMASDLQ